MLDVLCPGHLTDVNKSFDPFLQLDKRTVVCDGDDASLYPSSFGILGVDIIPRMGLKLLQAERDPLGLLVKIDHSHVHALVKPDDLIRMLHPSPGASGNVYKTINDTQV